jgi:predicted aspartyl protease
MFKFTPMGTIYIGCKIESPINRGRSVVVPRLLVDTGSELTWIPKSTLEKLGIAREKKDVAFVMANGQQLTRSVGFAVIHADKHMTIDEVVFAEKGDLLLLGARTLEGLNLMVDPTRRKLVAAGPVLAAPSGQVFKSASKR